jgi:hypothetical protein
MQDWEEIDDERELEWLIDRSTRITSSNIHKLKMKGRGVRFGKVAIGYIAELVFQIKRGDLIDSKDAWQLRFGKDNEPLAIRWLRARCGMDSIKSGTNDGDKILFRKELGEAFGDSTDYDVHNFEGIHYAIGEIKIPANKVKACDAIDNWTRESCVGEYCDQFSGHFIAAPWISELHYTVYNAHRNKLTGKYYDEGVTFIYTRDEFQGLIDENKYLIPRVHEFVLLCVKRLYVPEDINKWWAEKEYRV